MFDSRKNNNIWSFWMRETYGILFSHTFSVLYVSVIFGSTPSPLSICLDWFTLLFKHIAKHFLFYSRRSHNETVVWCGRIITAIGIWWTISHRTSQPQIAISVASAPNANRLSIFLLSINKLVDEYLEQVMCMCNVHARYTEKLLLAAVLPLHSAPVNIHVYRIPFAMK